MIAFDGTLSECEEIQMAENTAKGYPSQGDRNTEGEAGWTRRRVDIFTELGHGGRYLYQILDGLAAQVAPVPLRVRINAAREHEPGDRVPPDPPGQSLRGRQNAER